MSEPLREEICRRHGLSEAIAPSLVGTTRDELEADAAARAAVAMMIRRSQEPKINAQRAIIERLHRRGEGK